MVLFEGILFTICRCHVSSSRSSQGITKIRVNNNVILAFEITCFSKWMIIISESGILCVALAGHEIRCESESSSVLYVLTGGSLSVLYTIDVSYA